ncbi:MAG TPA: PilT/PilU family type 4a pilus ATPase [Actinomycetota bacterium]|nr:PilT/PilU family type 4a pilus ATPase [Actinomycetota bacterium]
MRELNSMLHELAERAGSDLHLKAGSAPLARIDGVLFRLGDERLSAGDTDAVARQICPQERLQELHHRGATDFAYGVPGLARFRVNAFRQRGSVSIVMRLVRVGSASLEELGLPPVVHRLAEEPRGLVLVTGPTGSGKTTTLAAMIDHINETRPCHIVTIEDPIEVLHPDRMAAVNQREVSVDCESFIDAMRSAMRQDPDVILIGEMRDAETVQAALAAAETGHLVLSTLHTIDAQETVNRVVDFFPPYQQHQVRVTLSGALRGILCQRLVPRKGGGRVPALEVMINTGRTAERIVDPGRTSEIMEVIADGGFYGMQTFDQALLDLVRRDLVEPQEAVEAASQRHDFELALQQAGIALPVG